MYINLQGFRISFFLMDVLFPFDLSTESEWEKVSSVFPFSSHKEALAKALEEKFSRRHQVKRLRNKGTQERKADVHKNMTSQRGLSPSLQLPLETEVNAWAVHQVQCEEGAEIPARSCLFQFLRAHRLLNRSCTPQNEILKYILP